MPNTRMFLLVVFTFMCWLIKALNFPLFLWLVGKPVKQCQVFTAKGKVCYFCSSVGVCLCRNTCMDGNCTLLLDAKGF